MSAEEQFLREIFGDLEVDAAKKADPSYLPAVDASEEAAICDCVDNILRSLSYRERQIIRRDYGVGPGFTYTLDASGKFFKVRRTNANGIALEAGK